MTKGFTLGLPWGCSRATGIINQVATKPESTCVKSLPQLIAKVAEIV